MRVQEWLWSLSCTSFRPTFKSNPPNPHHWEAKRVYKLDIKLNRRDNSAKHVKKFTVKSFTPELIELINKVYNEVFIKFGYDKINPA